MHRIGKCSKPASSSLVSRSLGNGRANSNPPKVKLDSPNLASSKLASHNRVKSPKVKDKKDSKATKKGRDKEANLKTVSSRQTKLSPANNSNPLRMAPRAGPVERARQKKAARVVSLKAANKMAKASRAN